MYCIHCGGEIEAGSPGCIHCGQEIPEALRAPATLPTYLAPAILTTIFCCIPLGIPAIVYAASVQGRLAEGDVAGALAASRKARLWSWIAFTVGLLVAVLAIVFEIVLKDLG